MKLPAFFTTKTSFTKIIGSLLFLLLPFIAFFLGMYYQAGTEVTTITQNEPIYQKPRTQYITPTPIKNPTKDWQTNTQIKPCTSPKSQLQKPYTKC